MWLCCFATVYLLPVGAHHMTDFEEKYETVRSLSKLVVNQDLDFLWSDSLSDHLPYCASKSSVSILGGGFKKIRGLTSQIWSSIPST